MEMVNLKDYVVALESGSRPKGGAVSNGIPSLGGEHINEYGGFNLEEDKLKYVPEKYFNSMKKGIIREGDILIVKDGATTGKCAYVGKDFKLKKACVNEHIFILRVNSDIIPKYLFYYLYSPIGQISILKDFRGATVGGISKNFINMQIYLPDLQTQHKIVQVLDKAQALIDKRKEQIKLCDELIQSLFYDMFGDPVSNKRGWIKFELNQICDVRDGTHDSPKYQAEGYPLITSKNIVDGKIDFSNVNYISYEDYVKINKRSKVDNGDIIMPMIGTIGNPVIVENFTDFAIKNVALIKFINNNVNNIYLKELLSSNFLKFTIQKESRGGTQKFLSLKDIRNLKIPLPPIELQNQFAEKVQKIEKQKQLLQQSLALLEDNFNSLMQKAFKGELFQ